MSKQKYPVPIAQFKYVSMAKDKINEVTVRKVAAYRDTVWIGEELKIPQGQTGKGYQETSVDS